MSSTNRGSKRVEQDAYQTPVWCVEKIVAEINWDQVANFFEPCRGRGNIYNTIPEVFWKEWCEITEGTDYLNTTVLTHDLIITNPPFSKALEFLQKSLSEAKTVIYLLRLNFLGSKKRRDFWKKNSPTHLFTLVPRPSFTGNGTDSIEYAWFIWDRGGIIKREPGIYVL